MGLETALAGLLDRQEVLPRPAELDVKAELHHVAILPLADATTTGALLALEVDGVLQRQLDASELR